MSTKTIDATDLRNNLSATLETVGKNDIIFIKSRGKLTGKAIIDDDLLEDLLSLQDGEYLAAIAEARKELMQGDVYTFDEVFGDVL